MEGEVRGSARRRSSKSFSYQRLPELVTRLELEGLETRKIARQMGLSEATVRSWIRKSLFGRGFGLNAVVDYNKIGLLRVLLVVKVSERYLPVARRVFSEMSETSYLVYFVPLLDGRHLVISAVPRESIIQYTSFISELRARGFFSSVDEILTFEWSRNPPMKVGSYDFYADAWELNLEGEVRREEILVKPQDRVKFDGVDLMIVELLQADPSVSLKWMANRRGLNYKRVLRHYRHVTQRGLVPAYRLNWIKTPYDRKSQRARMATHSYLLVDLVVKDVSGEELDRLMLATHRLPFLWFEEGGDNYSCEIPVPLDQANEVFVYLRDSLSEFQGRSRVLIGTYEQGPHAFSIQPKLYSQRERRWVFDSASVLKRVDQVLLTVTR